MLLNIIVFVAILGVLIFVHELGHFVAARLANIKVEEFAFGFPPRLFSWKRGETRYALNLLPFGGYVKLLGEDGGSEDPRAFGRQSVPVRLAVIIAGVGMNLILAVAVLWLGFIVGMVPLVSNPADLGGSQTSQVLVTGVRADSPAASISLASGDILLDFASPDAVQTFTHDHLGESVTLKVRRGDQIFEKTVTLSSDPAAPLGIGIAALTQVKLGVLPALGAAITETGKVIGATFEFLGNFFGQLFTKAKLIDGVSGPVGIYTYTASAIQLGFSYVLQILAMLSINLALINILPFPALDGGRGLFVLLEGIVRRKVVREEIEAIIHGIGFLLLLALIVIITYRDIVQLR